MTKPDLHQRVTDQIVAAIESGLASGDRWELPWVGLHKGRPYNATTDRQYRGVNVLMLWSQSAKQGYDIGAWASYKQWQARGAQVRKGERGTLIVYAGSATREHESQNSETGATETVEETYRFLRYSTVFNAAQVDGWTAPATHLPSEAERIERAERFVTNSGAEIGYGADSAYYIPALDRIGCPHWDAFKATEHSTATETAYGTLLHELTHWTGAKYRLDRNLRGRFGDSSYAAEELVAELGAAFLCAGLGITHEPRLDHAHYLAHWLELLKGNKRAIFTAAARATEACDYLEGLQAAAKAAA